MNQYLATLSAIGLLHIFGATVYWPRLTATLDGRSMTSIILDILAKIAEALLGDLFKDIVKGFSKHKKAYAVVVVIVGLVLFSYLKPNQDHKPNQDSVAPATKQPASTPPAQEPPKTPAPKPSTRTAQTPRTKPPLPEPQPMPETTVPSSSSPGPGYLTIQTPPGRADCKDYVSDTFQSELGARCTVIASQANITLRVNSLACGKAGNSVKAPAGRTETFETRTATADLTATITYKGGSRPVYTIRKQGRSTVFSDSSTTDDTLERDALDDAIKQISQRIKELS